MRYSFGLKGGKLDHYYMDRGGLYPTIDGGLRVPTKDLSPGMNWSEVERDGNAVGWIVLLPPLRTGYMPYITLPGNREQVVVNGEPTIPTEQLGPPRDAYLFAQSTSPVELDEIFIADQRVTTGTSPYRTGYANLPEPETPIAVVVDDTDLGLPAAVFGWAYGFADHRKRLTPSSDYAFTDGPIVEGQGLMLPLPDVSGAQAPFLYYAVTSPGGGRETGRVAGFVNLESFIYGTKPYAGPLKDRGRKPPAKNQTGVGKLPPVALGEHRPGSRSRPWCHEVDGPEAFGILAGRWRFYWMVKPEGQGASLLSQPTREITVLGDLHRKVKDLDEDEDPPAGWDLEVDADGKRRAVKTWRGAYKMGKRFLFKPPPNLKDNDEFSVVVQIVPEQGAAGYFQAGLTAIRGRTVFFRAGGVFGENGVPIFGYPSDSAPARPEIRLYSFTPPDADDPEADGTGIIPPDPTSKPDDPYGFGIPEMDVGDYKVAIADTTEGYPGEGPVSQSTPKLHVATNKRIKIRRKSRMTGIPNAEGTHRNKAGTPADWTSSNLTAPVAESVVEGVWSYSASSNQASGTAGASFWKRYSKWMELEQGSESNFNVVGTLEVLADFTGASQARVEFQYDDNSITDHALTNLKGESISLDGVGLRTLLPRGMAWGPGTPNAIPGGALRVRLRFAPDLSLAQWRQTALFRDFQIFPFKETLRKSEQNYPDADDLDAGIPATNVDTVSSAVPYPEETEWALGPTPQVAGSPVPEAFDPLGVWDFDGGTIPGTLGTLTNSPNSGTHAPVIVADADSPTGTGYGLEIFDTTTSSGATRYYEKTYAGSLITPTGALASRMLFRIPSTGSGLPTRGEVGTVQILDQNGDPFGLARVHTNGTVRAVRQKANGDIAETVTIVSGAAPGSIIDVEVCPSGEDTNQGKLRISAGVNGPRTANKIWSGLDYRNRHPRKRRIGGFRESDAAAKWKFRIYSVVDTPGGDVLYREQPEPGVATTPPDPDAPPVTGTDPNNPSGFRLLDTRGQKINQWAGIIEPGTSQGNGYSPRTLRPIVVIPGETYTQAAQARGHFFDGAPEEDSHHLFVILTRDDGSDPLYVGSPFGAGKDAALVGRVCGDRSIGLDENLDPVDLTSMQPDFDWEAEDFWHHFTVPAWDMESGEKPYTEAHVLPLGDVPGIYILQEHLFTPGALATQTARDARRDYGRLISSGTFVATIDTAGIGMEMTPSPVRAQELITFGASHGDPEAAPLVWTSRATDQRDPYTGWSPYSTDPHGTPGKEVLQITGTLGQDAGTGNWPEIPAGAIHVETRPHTPVLLDQYRQALPGQIMCGATEEFTKAEANEEPVNGHAFSIEIGDDVTQLDSVSLLAFTVEGWRFLTELTPNDIVFYEDPLGGDDGLGRVYKLRFMSSLSVARRTLAVRFMGGIKRTFATVSESPALEVLESSAMGAARGY